MGCILFHSLNLYVLRKEVLKDLKIGSKEIQTYFQLFFNILNFHNFMENIMSFFNQSEEQIKFNHNTNLQLKMYKYN